MRNIFLFLILSALTYGCGKSPSHHHPETSATTERQISDNPQTLCPVMGGEINKTHYSDYKGKRVYFCCPGCDKTFSQNPEKYLEKIRERGERPVQVPGKEK